MTLKPPLVICAAVGLWVLSNLTSRASDPATLTCQRSVESVGIGRSLESDEGSRRQGIALAAALADAIARVRGVSVSAETTLRETITELQTNTALEVTSNESFTRELQSRIAGFVTSYTISQLEVKDGGLEISLKAQVCTDLRFGVAVVGSEQVRGALAAALTQGSLLNRWRIAVVPSVDGGDRRALYDVAFRYGLDLIATGGVVTQPVVNRTTTLTSRLVTLNVALLDVASGATLDNFSASQPAVGRSADDAEREALMQLGSSLAGRWGATLSPEAARGRVTFMGFKRPGSPLKLRELIASLSGVIAVEQLVSEASQQATFSITLGRPLCDVANDVVRSRVMTMWLKRCDPASAEIQIERD